MSSHNMFSWRKMKNINNFLTSALSVAVCTRNSQPQWLSQMHVQLVIGKLQVQSQPGLATFS